MTEALPQNIFGHQREREQIFAEIANRSAPHALLLSGPNGIGKQLLAQTFAKALLCQTPQCDGPCHQCESCHLYDTGNIPDLFVVDCNDKETSNTSHIRELLYSLHLKTFHGNNRVVIIIDAEHLQLQAANTLLKSLEEPHEGTFFLLTTSNHSQLLPTIISRCQCWRLSPLSQDDIMAIAQKRFPSIQEETLRTLALLADGSVENIENLETHLADWKRIKKLIEKITHGDVTAALSLVHSLPKKKEELPGILQVMRIATRRLLLKEPHPSLAYLLSELTLVDHYIYTRNINAQYLLQYIFTNTAKGNLTAESITEIAA